MQTFVKWRHASLHREESVVKDITDEQCSSNGEGSRDTIERELTTELETLSLQLRAKCSFYEDELSGECCLAHIC